MEFWDIMSIMQSIIIAATNETDRHTHTEKLLHEAAITAFDITIIDDETLGIEEVRKMQKAIYLKPRGKYKAIVLRNASHITVDAQNALLKVLEEPPDDTLIILEVEKSDNLLPTICSRCKIVTLRAENTTTDIPHDSLILNSLSSMAIGEKLKLAQDNGKTKEDAIKFLKALTMATRQENNNGTFTHLLKSLQKTHTIIETSNVTPRFALENLLLSL